jgi:Rrf2 family iron-sulfur cluster assembly transcriptional regulator
MILTTKGRYAVTALIEIAENKSNNLVTLLTISKKQKISLSYLEQIFAKLRKADIVKSIKGPGGGYVLAKSKMQITIADIIAAIGESIKVTKCSGSQMSCKIGENSKSVNSHVKCKTHDLWQGLERRIYTYLKSVSIADICEDNNTVISGKACQDIQFGLKING